MIICIMHLGLGYNDPNVYLFTLAEDIVIFQPFIVTCGS